MYLDPCLSGLAVTHLLEVHAGSLGKSMLEGDARCRSEAVLKKRERENFSHLPSLTNQIVVYGYTHRHIGMEL